MKASGPAGELRVGYQHAAVLGAWRLEMTPTIPMIRCDIEAAVVSSDAFWSTQRPMILDLRFGRFHWIWEQTMVTFTNGCVTTRVHGKPYIVKESDDGQ